MKKKFNTVNKQQLDSGIWPTTGADNSYRKQILSMTQQMG